MHCFINSKHQWYTHCFTCSLMVSVMEGNKFKYTWISYNRLLLSIPQGLIKDNCRFLFCWLQLKATCYLSTEDILISQRLSIRTFATVWCYCHLLILQRSLLLPVSVSFRALHSHCPVSKYKICQMKKKCTFEQTSCWVQRASKLIVSASQSTDSNLLHSFTRWRYSH